MKSLYLLPFFLIVTLNTINAQPMTYVPDDNFEQYLITQNLDDAMDDYVLTDNISSLPILNVQGLGINDFTGIENFTALQILHCEDNNIPVIDISGASALRELYCFNNQLTELDVSHNPVLKLLACYNNDIGSLDVSQNSALTNLSCSNNSLKSLNVSGAASLSILLCERNELVVLDLSQNIALKILNCQFNQLLILNVNNGHNNLITSFIANQNPQLTCIGVDDPVKASNKEAPYLFWQKDAGATYSDGCVLPRTYLPDNEFERVLFEMGYDDIADDDSVVTYYLTLIETLDIAGEGIEELTGIEEFVNLANLNCSNNQLVNLDLSKNTLLTELNCSSNLLTGLNLRNGSNYLLTSFDGSNNPQLECIEVDNEVHAVNGNAPYDAWIIDPSAGYSANCALFGEKTYVPDDNFEKALVNLGYDADPLDDYVSASIISRVTSLNVASQNIHDLTGIEGFRDLKTLSCYNNLLQSLDVSQNSALLTLSCYTNQLSELDLSGNGSLINLNITNNLFEGALDLSDCPDLKGLDCQNNQVTGLILSGNQRLETLNCRKNLLTSLDLTGIDSLKSLDCYNNLLTSLDLSNKPLLTLLDCGYNQITQLLVNGSDLRNIKCSYNQLTSLDVSEFSMLNQLDCHNNQLTALDVSSKPELWFLDCSYNLLAEINLTGTSGLIDFVCRNNQLTGLDVSGSPLLGGLYCSNNKIGSLDVTNNPDLLTLHCQFNELTSLYLVPNTKLKYLWANDNVLLVGFDGPSAKGGTSGENRLTNTSLRSLNLRNTGLETINVLDLGFLDSLDMSGTQLTSLDVSGNPMMKYLNTTGTSLGCIQVNQDQLNSIPTGWIADASTVYSVDCEGVSTDTRGLAESVRLYPNPVRDILTVESDSPIFNVEIYSIAGHLVKEIHSGFSAIPLNDLAEGTYTIKVESAGGVVSRKLSVRH